LGPEPANQPTILLLGALVIERDEALQNGDVRKTMRPTVCIEYCGVEVVVDLFQNRDEAVFMNRSFFRRELVAAPQLLEHVVHRGDRERGMELLLTFPVCIELLAEGANPLS